MRPTFYSNVSTSVEISNKRNQSGGTPKATFFFTTDRYSNSNFEKKEKEKKTHTHTHKAMSMTYNFFSFLCVPKQRISDLRNIKTIMINTREKHGLLDKLYFNSLHLVFQFASLLSSFVLF